MAVPFDPGNATRRGDDLPQHTTLNDLQRGYDQMTSKPCIVKSKIVEGDFTFLTFFCGKRQRCFKQPGEEASHAELPDDAVEKARNANACAKCVRGIEREVERRAP